MNLQSLPFIALFSALWALLVASLVLGVARIFHLGLSSRENAEESIHVSVYLVLILVTGIAVLWISPYQASNLAISDSVEYAVGAERLLNLHSYSLNIEGQELPPRYGPWFSVFFVAPSMLLAGRDLGNAIWGVTLLALLGPLIAFCIARRLSSTWGGVLAALSVLLDPGYRYFSKFPMTDVPAAVLVLVTLGLCLVVYRAKTAEGLAYFALGVLAATAGALRPLALFVLVPVFWMIASEAGKHRLFRFVAVAAPVAMSLLLQCSYNLATFGSVLRSGYNFWLPWPYDFADKVFSLSYVLANKDTLLFHTPIPIALVIFFGTLPLFRQKAIKVALDQKSYRFFLTLVLMFGIPTCVVYLLYFYSTSRFFLPVGLLLYVGIGAALGALLGELEKKRLVTLVLLIGIASATVGWRSSLGGAADAPRRRAAENFIRYTGSTAVIVTAIDPVYLEPGVIRGTQRSIIPISRRVEYASKVVAWSPLFYVAPLPEDPLVLPRDYLLHLGARDVVHVTALENPEYIDAAVASGRPVFFDTTTLESSEVERFSRRYMMQEVTPGLFQVSGHWSQNANAEGR